MKKKKRLNYILEAMKLLSYIWEATPFEVSKSRKSVILTVDANRYYMMSTIICDVLHIAEGKEFDIDDMIWHDRKDD